MRILNSKGFQVSNMGFLVYLKNQSVCVCVCVCMCVPAQPELIVCICVFVFDLVLVVGGETVCDSVE